MRSLAGQVAVVTGAGSGVGRAISLALAAQGVSVCLVGRNLSTLESVGELARDKAPIALCYCTDLTRDQDLRELKSKVLNDVNGVDLLVHCAGTMVSGPIESSSVDDMDLQYRINLRAPYVLTQQFLALIKERQG